MAAPSIVKVSPNPNAIDVVLGANIEVTFDQVIDTTTITPSTFSLTGPGQTQFVSPQQLNQKTPHPSTGREYVEGTFTFSTDANGNTVVSFNPSRPLRPNLVYTVLVVGAPSAGQTVGPLGDVVKNLAGDALNASNQWSFTTGDLNIVTPPASSPLPQLILPLDPSQVKIKQKVWPAGNNLSQEIDIVFPAAIDPNTISTADILMSLEPILNDPTVPVPTGLVPTVTIEGNMIRILITGWPAD